MTNKDRKNKVIKDRVTEDRRTEGTEKTNDKEKPLPQPLPHREGSEYRDTPLDWRKEVCKQLSIMPY